MDTFTALYRKRKYDRCVEIFKLVYTIMRAANVKDDYEICKTIGITYNAWRVWARFEGGPNREHASKIFELNTIKGITVNDLWLDTKALRHEVRFELNTRGGSEKVLIRGRNLTVQ